MRLKEKHIYLSLKIKIKMTIIILKIGLKSIYSIVLILNWQHQELDPSC